MDELSQLRSRLDRLQKENNELKSQLQKHPKSDDGSSSSKPRGKISQMSSEVVDSNPYR